MSFNYNPNIGRNLYQQLVSSGNPLALMECAVDELTQSQNDEKAQYYFQELARTKIEPSEFKTIYGKHIIINQLQVKKIGITQFHLAQLYEKGDGVKKNILKSAQFFHAAANNGCYEAQRKMSSFYTTGLLDENKRVLIKKDLGFARGWQMEADKQLITKNQPSSISYSMKK